MFRVKAGSWQVENDTMTREGKASQAEVKPLPEGGWQVTLWGPEGLLWGGFAAGYLGEGLLVAEDVQAKYEKAFAAAKRNGADDAAAVKAGLGFRPIATPGSLQVLCG